MTTKKNYEIGTEAKSIIVHNAAQAHMTASDYFNNLVLGLPSQVYVNLYNDGVEKYNSAIYALYTSVYIINPATFHKNEGSARSDAILSIRVNSCVAMIIFMIADKHKIPEAKVAMLLIALGLEYWYNAQHFIKCYNVKFSKSKNLLNVHGNKSAPIMSTILYDIVNASQTNSIIEPFAGACAATKTILSAIGNDPKSYTLGDADKEKCNLYFCVREKPNELKSACLLLALSIIGGYDNFDVLKKQSSNLPDKITAKNCDYIEAAIFLYRNVVSVHSKGQNLIIYKGKHLSKEQQANLFANHINCISDYTEMLRKINFIHSDVNSLLNKPLSPCTLVYLDPPYINTWGYTNPNNGLKEFKKNDHLNLFEFAKKNYDKCKFVLSCRFTATRQRSKEKTHEDVRNDEANGFYAVKDAKISGFHFMYYGSEAKKAGKQFYYIEVPFDNKGTIEVFITNFWFPGCTAF